MRAVIDYIHRPRCGCVVAYVLPLGEARWEIACPIHRGEGKRGVEEEGQKRRQEKLLTERKPAV